MNFKPCELCPVVQSQVCVCPLTMTHHYTGLLIYTRILHRQNRRDRHRRKRWSQIATDHVILLDNNEMNVISLKVNKQIRISEFQFVNKSAVMLVPPSLPHESTDF